MSDQRARQQRQARPTQPGGGRRIGTRRCPRWAFDFLLVVFALALALTPAFSTEALSKSKSGESKASLEKSESRSDSEKRSKKKSSDSRSKSDQSSKAGTNQTSSTGSDSQQATSSSNTKASQSSTSAKSSTSASSSTASGTPSTIGQSAAGGSQLPTKQQGDQQQSSQTSSNTTQPGATPAATSLTGGKSESQAQPAATPGATRTASTAQAAGTPSADGQTSSATATAGAAAATDATPGPTPTATAAPGQTATGAGEAAAGQLATRGDDASSGDQPSSGSATPVPTRSASASPRAAAPAPRLASKSGDAVSSGSNSQTVLANGQVSGVETGGGKASATSGNIADGGVLDTGVADSQSGASVAIPAQGTSSGASATSGSAAASGLAAQNTVVNSSTGSVQVAGKNHADIENYSVHETTVENVGQASATTGDAYVNYSSSRRKNNSSSAKGPRSEPISDTGSTGQTTVTGGTSSTTYVGGGVATTRATGDLTTNAKDGAVKQQVASNTGLTPVPVSTDTAITVEHEQEVELKSGGQAEAKSLAACATAKCNPTGAAAQAGAGGVSAATGAARASGLEAQNVVTTQGQASVNVKGENYGVITLVVESLTRIFNHGKAQSVSGRTQSVEYAVPASGTSDSLASRGVSTPTGGGAQSGGADATGARLTNEVNLSSKASVKVEGDNHNPIELLLEMAVNLVNWGKASSTSGDAAAGGEGGRAGSSQAASGSSSATGLTVQNLVNLNGLATVDIEGNNYAPITVWLRFITEIENEGSARAKSGNVDSGDQLERKGDEFRTASGLVIDTRDGQSLLEQGLLTAQTGAAVAVGNQSSVAIVNYQLAGTANPQGESVAFNFADFLVDAWGAAGASSGDASAGLPPPPPPQPDSARGVTEWPDAEEPPLLDPNGWLADGVAVGVPTGGPLGGLPVGTLVAVESAAGWPAAALPPMPAPRMPGDGAGVDLGWPNGEPIGTPWPPGGRGGSPNLAPFPWPGQGSNANASTGSLVDVNPWALWPGAMGPAMPDQVANESALRGRNDNDGLIRRPQSLTPEHLAAFLAAGGLAIGGLWRRRALVVAIALNSLVGLRAAVLLLGRHWLVSFVRLWCLALLAGVGLARILTI